MLNKYPLWKYLLILAVLAVGFIYSTQPLPGRPGGADQRRQHGAAGHQADVDRAAKGADAGIAVKAEACRRRAADPPGQQDDQLPPGSGAPDPDDYVVALNWPRPLPSGCQAGRQPMKLGLDLSGGVHFLLEVDMTRRSMPA